jgi:hypothetical protein
MNMHQLKLAALAVVPAAMLTITGCSSPSGTEQTAVIDTPDGATIVDTFTTMATVTRIDADKRELTLVAPNGRKTTYKAGPEVANFNQLQVGNRIQAVLTEEVAVSIGSGAAPVGTSGVGVALAPVGAEPGGVMVETSEVTATITAVDTKNHKITYQLPDGTTNTVKAGKHVDVSILSPGDSVTIQVGEGLMVSAERP